MEIIIVIIATILLPVIVISALIWLEHKFRQAQKKREDLICVMEEIIEIQSDSIKTLRF
jgi:uncharacterized paraquat-inducible protein A